MILIDIVIQGIIDIAVVARRTFILVGFRVKDRHTSGQDDNAGDYRQAP
jgi:hypothetical protein